MHLVKKLLFKPRRKTASGVNLECVQFSRKNTVSLFGIKIQKKKNPGNHFIQGAAKPNGNRINAFNNFSTENDFEAFWRPAILSFIMFIKGESPRAIESSYIAPSLNGPITLPTRVHAGITRATKFITNQTPIGDLLNSWSNWRKNRNPGPSEIRFRLPRAPS